MKWGLAQEYEVFDAGDRLRALQALTKESPDLVTLDLGLPPDPDGVAEGFSLLAEILEQNSLTKIIVITGREEREHALRAIEDGAYDYFCKPIQMEELKVILRRALHVFQLEYENVELQRRLNADSFEGMLGSSPQMQEVFTKIRKVATSDVPVLILGESGTGKELAARAIHQLGSIKRSSFIAINCGAIPKDLLESELFGYEKGAFTGANAQRKGRIESAQGGTLFLDEIGNLPLDLQVKLLRFLQEHRLVRVGGREEINVDARIISATNSDLNEAMTEGRFRDDLYYRLGVVIISLPPLREREGDIPVLAKALLAKFAAGVGKKVKGFTTQALTALESNSWPGNVRELENRIKRAVIMADGSKLTPADLELEAVPTRYQGLGLKDAREVLERELVQRALKKHDGNITQTAAELGISRPTLYELMEKLGIPKK